MTRRSSLLLVILVGCAQGTGGSASGGGSGAAGGGSPGGGGSVAMGGGEASGGGSPASDAGPTLTLTFKRGPQGSGVVGAVFAPKLIVHAALADGGPARGAQVRFSTEPADAGGGWAFAESPFTGDGGDLRLWWVPGVATVQTLRAEAEGALPLTVSTAVDTVPAKANSVHLFFDGFVEGMRTTLVPQTDPKNTYYEAIGFEGGYCGIQAQGQGQRRTLFSVWDVDLPDGGILPAQLVDAGASACNGFGGEGTGLQCWLDTPWVPGDAVTFEVRKAFDDGGTLYSAYFTGRDGGAPVWLATLRHQAHVASTYSYAFAEDYGPESSSCLTAPQRLLRVRDVAGLVDGGWVRQTHARFTHAQDWTHCSNMWGGVDGGDFVLSAGGPTASSPDTPTELDL